MRQTCCALLMLALAGTACTGEVTKTADAPRPIATSTASEAGTDRANPFAPDDAGRPAFEEDEPGRGQDRRAPLAVGSATPIGEWLVRIVGYDPDATDAIMAFHDQSVPPPAGHQYALARIEATWGGDGASNAFLNFEWGLVDSNGTTWSDVDCPVLPDDLANVPGVQGDQVANGTICFVIDAQALDDVVLYVAPLLAPPVDRRWWVAPATGRGKVLAPTASEATPTPSGSPSPSDSP